MLEKNEAELKTDENLINERRNQFELTKQKLRSRGVEEQKTSGLLITVVSLQKKV
jgi:hypothetical protein